MNMHFDIQVLRTKLLAMARLAHGAVDRSLKATQSGREDMRGGAVRNDNQEMSAICAWIARHEHTLMTAAQTDAAHARFVSAALRMSKGLEAAYAAALEIAQENQVRTVTGVAPNAKEPDTGIHTDEFADERLTGLEMRVCELLFKNQRLRMALMAEGEDRRHELLV
jgi:hypothetical protein